MSCSTGHGPHRPRRAVHLNSLANSAHLHAGEAALTGHLVFATLHTNNAIQAVTAGGNRCRVLYGRPIPHRHRGKEAGAKTLSSMQNKMAPMRYDGLKKVIRGLTSLEEIDRTVPDF